MCCQLFFRAGRHTLAASGTPGGGWTGRERSAQKRCAENISDQKSLLNFLLIAVFVQTRERFGVFGW